MLAKRATLALLAVQALSALASPVEPFTVQDSELHLVSDSIYSDTVSIKPAANNPLVHLDNGSFFGVRKPYGKVQIDHFLGIPFALPPTGSLRLRPPKPVPPYTGTHYVQKFGKSCPQQALTLPNGLNSRLVEDIGVVLNQLYQNHVPSDEDCLTVNVVRPSSATSKSKLPVLVWIYGGGFEIGGSALYDGATIVSRSIDLKQPVIFVSMNYRLSAFGFLPGKEVKKANAGNLGLRDQRVALQWVKKYIEQFGGDSKKVTIWGESAGAISVALHMVTEKGNQKGLFRGAVMQSGGPIPVGKIENGQKYYDFMVKETNCTHKPNTLDCLRKVPYYTFKNAVDKSPNFFAYQALSLAWLPRVDGVFLTEPPQQSILNGRVSTVPVITGNCDDEGSLFSISTINISTTAHLKRYLKQIMMPRANNKELDTLLKHYPDNVSAGSPFDTGKLNALGPQFKRTAALQGDFVFHGPRRFFLKQRASKQNSWGFVYKRFKSTPYIGSAHAMDLLASFGPMGELKDYIIRFTNKLDPNGREGLGIQWPKWDPKRPRALIFKDDANSRLVIDRDDYRASALNYVANLSIRYPI